MELSSKEPHYEQLMASPIYRSCFMAVKGEAFSKDHDSFGCNAMHFLKSGEWQSFSV